MLGLLPGAAVADEDRSYLWVFSPEVNVPVSAKFTLAGIAACGAERRFCLDFPLLTFGFDVRRPSGERAGSINLSFAQAPLVGLAAIAAMESRSPALKVAALPLAWLSGGMARWAPGGEGNLSDGPAQELTLGLVAKNEIAFHPFVTPAYVRATPGIGLAVTRLAGEGPARSLLTCGVGAFTSLAFASGGQRSFDPGGWLTCQLTGD